MSTTSPHPEAASALEPLPPAVRGWFRGAFAEPTRAQTLAWPAIARGESTLLLAPTGSGKTLAAFLVSLGRLMFDLEPDAPPGVRLVYVSPLKALGADVEKNLKAPLVGLQALARRTAVRARHVTVGIRSGDTPAAERERLRRHPPDILITTPESLYLMLSSRVRAALGSVDTVIIDEIHALSGTKRGAHLMLSIERLESLRRSQRPLQRIGLSATQRPLEEVARLLGGFHSIEAPTRESEPASSGSRAQERKPRPVTIVDAGRTKRFDLRIEVPVEDLTDLSRGAAPSREGSAVEALVGSSSHAAARLEQRPPAAAAASQPGPGGSEAPPVLGAVEDNAGDAESASIWPAIAARVLELIRDHRCTLVFVNSRQVSERFAARLNELAGEELALAHHGSVAKDTRLLIEDRLKRGELPALVATASLELGIDMGAIDLVIQIEAPRSVASALQRIGRAGHGVGEVSRGVFFPKYRGDLLACAAAVERSLAGAVEETHYPRLPLDVLSQHIVSMLVAEPLEVEALYKLVVRAAPFAELPQSIFEGVLDMLSGRYPSERFRELRPRIDWDRIGGKLSARPGAQLLTASNPGTIVDRGLYGVFVAHCDPPRRVGELDEEMVFESRVGEVFLLGASSWRVEEITHDRVLVSPAPGEAARMPFWHGSRPGRPLEFGRAMGRLTRQLERLGDAPATELLRQTHCMTDDAAINLLAYVREQSEESVVPTDRRIVIESFLDEVGDWKVVVLSPFGGRVHAPWATVVCAQLREQHGYDVDSTWLDDGMVFRLPEADEPPDPGWFVPRFEQGEQRLRESLGTTALFAAHFRENASRALLLPRRRPGRRMPLWLQRRRSADLLAVATEFDDFPIVLETYRQCLRDVFDLPGLREVLGAVEQGDIAVESRRLRAASPFGSALLFSFVGNFIYSTDAPLAERRAQALALDQSQLRLLLGEPELRQLLNPEVLSALSAELSRLEQPPPLRAPSALHVLLLELGDLSDREIDARLHAAGQQPSLRPAWLEALTRRGQALSIRVAGEPRWVAGEDAARYRDGLGCVLPMGVVSEFLEPVRDPLGDLVLRYARTHGPFSPRALCERYGLSLPEARAQLEALCSAGQLARGAFLPEGQGEEYCHSQVLARLKRLSLSRLRHQIEPVEAPALARFVFAHQGLEAPGRGLDGVLNAIEQLEGCELPLADLVGEILPARVEGFRASDLDELCAAGELVWRGVAAGGGSPRVALYLSSHYAALAAPAAPVSGELADKIREILQQRGAVFFSELCERVGGFPDAVFTELWAMVWAGEVSNDTLSPLRSLGAAATTPSAGSSSRSSSRSSHSARGRFRSRRAVRPGTEGRWALLQIPTERATPPTPAERAAAWAETLLRRYGVVCREAVRHAGVPGGFSAVYSVLRALEEAGRVRRGYFVEGLGAAQFALPGSDNGLRARRRVKTSGLRWLAAYDPANPYGAWLPWPAHPTARPGRVAGALVALLDGELCAFLGPRLRNLSVYAPDRLSEAQLRGHLERLAQALVARFEKNGEKAWLLQRVEGRPVGELLGSANAAQSKAEGDGALGRLLCDELRASGFVLTAQGLQLRRAAAAGLRRPGAGRLAGSSERGRR